MPELGKTTLYCTPQRLYDSENGVFISRDPLLYADSPSPYTYSAHNPVDYADPTGWAKTPIGGIPEGQWVKETIIHEEEVHFYEGQNTPPPPPDHKFGFYPLKDADKYLSQQYGDAWETVKSTFKYGPLKNVGDVLGIIEDLDPINAPDHFLSAGSYAKRWVWFSQRGQTGRGLFELFQGHLEASSAVGGVEIGGVLLKGGTALGTAALAKGAKYAEGPKVYSVAMEVHLTPGEVPAYVSDEARRTRHRNIGQDAVYKMIDGWNKSLNPEERELGKRMNELLKNSNDWHLHHDPKRAGVLQLVLTEQHQAPSYQNLFHPLETKPSGRVGRVGGFFTGAAYTNQPLREWTGFLFREDPLQTP